MKNANTPNKCSSKATVAKLVTMPGFRGCNMGLKQGA